MQRKTSWWVLGSAVLMIVGAFGRWATVQGPAGPPLEWSGINSSFHGWIIVAAAAIGCGLAVAMRRAPATGGWALAVGIAGIAVTARGHSQIDHLIHLGRIHHYFVQGQLDWGFWLALAASVSIAVAGVVALIQARSRFRTRSASAPRSAI